ncbi:MAG: phytoene desaturase [Telmatospirillum sp.]|nr:phytoene desaturase [Telmatospirillum sp.]
MERDPILIVGAGIGGLACAIDLAGQGLPVIVIERAAGPGGKMRECQVGARRIDSGPTVLTMRWVFDDLFCSAGSDLDHHVTLHPLDVLARHFWEDGRRFDLLADLGAAADAVGRFAGMQEAARFLSFCIQSRSVYQTLKGPFLTAARAGPVALARRIGVTRLGRLAGLRPCESLWNALCAQFQDPRLRQLFGRYATYCGSSPFRAPATLMLIAHVEREGVWIVEGGMQRLADALERLGRTLGVGFRYDAEVSEIVVEGGRAAAVRMVSGERIAARAIVVNADAAALVAGCFGEPVRAAAPVDVTRHRSLSAITWARVARPCGVPLTRHNVFFSGDYAAEFNDLFGHRRVPGDPTVYLCAQDRPGRAPGQGERLLLLINAPATGDRDGGDGSQTFNEEEMSRCGDRVRTMLGRCGLQLEGDPREMVVTTPRDFHRMFPATGGALYGRTTHGWRASFQRPGAQTPVPGLYLAGGSTHPGAGVPMAALSGRLAAGHLIEDLVSTRTFRKEAIAGGMWTG